MPLSWNEIKQRAIKFSHEWKDETSENAEAKSFWDNFFNVFGINRRRVATFELNVKKLNDKQGFIDLFWKGTLLVEHKSKGRNLDKAFEQAIDYFPGIKEAELPKYILVSDFARFRLFDLEEKEEHEFEITDLHKNVKLFGFIAGYKKQTFRDEHPINIKAAVQIGKLHDRLKEIGYDGHQLEVYLVRLMFLLFAEDTNIFEKNLFWEYIDNNTKEDGSDLASKLAELFQILNTPREKRLKNIDESLNAFPYVNGKLFEENLPIAAFDSEMRNILIENCALEWSLISPAIFGSLFQSIMDKTARRNLGAHYTSEKNIMKVIKPLFLDKLWTEFEKVKHNKRKLEEFHHSLSKLNFLDPACGSGNFLIISYRELRLLELEILRTLLKNQQVTTIENKVWIDVDQFYGIEIDEWASKIAETAMWLIDHQMNMLISEEFGNYFARIPLNKSANIHNANALQLDWEEVIPKSELSYIIGNPPFIGSKFQTPEQRNEVNAIFEKAKGAKIMDYVSAWFIKAAKYIQNTNIKVAFVSTNSISQGEQTGVLWKEMMNKYNIIIHFAHRTFKWSNEAKGKAVVYVIITGFANFDVKQKTIFDYEDIQGEPHAISVNNINPYLVEAKTIIIQRRNFPISTIPPFIIGSKPLDGGYLCLSPEEKKELILKEPLCKKFIRPLIGSREFLHNQKRFCLWLVDATPRELKSMKMIMERIKSVKVDRLNGGQSKQSCADKPHLFGDNRQPVSNYLVIPKLSSMNRRYIPMGFYNPKTIVTDLVSVIPKASLWHFGILTSEIHMTWVKYICGRFKSDYRYTNIVYNNFPWPKNVSDKNKKKVELTAQKVLDTRAEFPDSSLADLYDPLTMPPALVKAHQALDKAVDLCYRPQAFTNERNRIEYLFDLYTEYTRPLEAAVKKEKKKRKKK